MHHKYLLNSSLSGFRCRTFCNQYPSRCYNIVRFCFSYFLWYLLSLVPFRILQYCSTFDVALFITCAFYEPLYASILRCFD